MTRIPMVASAHDISNADTIHPVTPQIVLKSSGNKKPRPPVAGAVVLIYLPKVGASGLLEHRLGVFVIPDGAEVQVIGPVLCDYVRVYPRLCKEPQQRNADVLVTPKVT